jgi:hypothetical protein
MDIVAAKKGEKQSDAWEEQLKYCVELLVEKLAGNNTDLRRTQYVIQHQYVRSGVNANPEETRGVGDTAMTGDADVNRVELHKDVMSIVDVPYVHGEQEGAWFITLE